MSTYITLLDCDTVLGDLMGDVLRVINKELGEERFRYEDMQDFWISNVTADEGYDEEEINTIMNADGFIENLTVCPGAQAGVEALKGLGEVFVLTKPSRHSPTWVYERLIWLQKNFGIDANHVVHTGAKHLVYGNLFVDDLHENIHTWNRRWQNSHSVLWDAPWNQNDNAHYRTGSWNQLVNWAEKFKRLRRFC